MPVRDKPQLQTLEEVTRAYVVGVLAACKGHRAKAASVLGVDRKTLYRMLTRWGLQADLE
jgi:DNA-binding NtrC family response regulator